jgi:hypothetical protein
MELTLSENRSASRVAPRDLLLARYERLFQRISPQRGVDTHDPFDLKSPPDVFPLFPSQFDELVVGSCDVGRIVRMRIE